MSRYPAERCTGAARFGLAAACLFGSSSCAEPITGQRGLSEAVGWVTGTDEGACARHRSRVLTPIGSADRSSPILLAEHSGRPVAIVADEDEHAIFTIDRQSGTVLSTLHTEDAAPTHLMMTLDGRILASFPSSNEVVVYEPGRMVDASLERRCVIPLASEPRYMARLPGRDAFLVSSGWGRSLSKVDLATSSVQWSTQLAHEPRGITISDDGKRAFVGHAVGGVISTVTLAKPSHVTEIPIATRIGTAEDAAEQSANQGYELISLALPGRARGSEQHRLFAPHVSIRPTPDSRFVSGYGDFRGESVTMRVAVIDPSAEKLPMLRGMAASPRRGLTTTREGCALPRAIVASGHRLWVSCLDRDAVIELDARAADPAGVELSRTQVPPGPTGLALDNDRGEVVVWSQFSRALTTISVDATAQANTKSVYVPARAAPGFDPVYARGRELFHTTNEPRLSRTGQACASCHPDGRQDGLVWPSPDGPRQTVHLSGRIADTAPYGWFGEHEALSGHIQQTIGRLNGVGYENESDPDLIALTHFVAHMPAPSRGIENDLEARGRELFESTAQGCASCHPDGGTNQVAFDVGSGSSLERRSSFDTPTLAFVGGTAPYFHDGRYDTLDDLLRETDGQMGHTAELAPSDRQALIAYLERL